MEGTAFVAHMRLLTSNHISGTRSGRGRVRKWREGRDGGLGEGIGKPRPKHHISERKNLKKIGEG